VIDLGKVGHYLFCAEAKFFEVNLDFCASWK